MEIVIYIVTKNMRMRMAQTLNTKINHTKFKQIQNIALLKCVSSQDNRRYWYRGTSIRTKQDKRCKPGASTVNCQERKRKK